MEERLRIAGVVNDSIVDGPGFRLTVFTQGCPHRCPGCHNPQSHDLAGGRVETVASLVEKLQSNPLLDGLTLSGGEPFLQPRPRACLAIQAHALGLTVWTYTGYTYEELLSGAAGEEAQLLLAHTDVLVDGRFELDQRTLEAPFRGSANQRLIDVAASQAAGSPVLWQG